VQNNTRHLCIFVCISVFYRHNELRYQFLYTPLYFFGIIFRNNNFTTLKLLLPGIKSHVVLKTIDRVSNVHLLKSNYSFAKVKRETFIRYAARDCDHF